MAYWPNVTVRPSRVSVQFVGSESVALTVLSISSPSISWRPGWDRRFLTARVVSFVLPAAMRKENIFDGKLAIVVEPPQEAVAISVWMGGAPPVAHIEEGDIDEAIVRCFHNIEAVDCAGGIDASGKGGILISAINPDDEFRRPFPHRTVEVSIRSIRSSWQDIYLRPTEDSVTEAGSLPATTGSFAFPAL
jgi:hypothetical protein